MKQNKFVNPPDVRFFSAPAEVLKADGFTDLIEQFCCHFYLQFFSQTYKIIHFSRRLISI